MSRLDVHVIITFEEVYGKDKLPENRLDCLKGTTKKGVLTRLSKINTIYLDQIYHTIIWDKQIQLLKAIFNNDLTKVENEIPSKFWRKVRQYKERGATPSIFSRVSTLIGLEEILLSTLPNDGDDNLEPIDFFMYCLLLNSYLNKYQNINSVDQSKILDLFPFFGPINEHTLPRYPFSELIRGLKLLKYFKSHNILKDRFLDFENEKGIEFEFFFLLILSVLSVETPSVGNLFNGRKSESFFQMLSENEVIRGRQLLEAINIKRNSFYRYDDDNWFLMDYLYLVDNFFNSLITTFWFEYLKPNNVISAKGYFGEIGLFFETYTCSILKNCFHFYKHPSALLLEQLKVK